jgi:hypothetical protein
MSWYKVASNPKPVPLFGTLCDNNGYIYLKIDNRIIVPFLSLISDGSVKSPKEVTEKSKDVGAHITIMKKDESEGKDIKEIGEEFEFYLTGLESVKPDGWEEVKKVYFLTVDSEQIEKLRTKYKLPPKIKGHNFHITVGVES